MAKCIGAHTELNFFCARCKTASTYGFFFFYLYINIACDEIELIMNKNTQLQLINHLLMT